MPDGGASLLDRVCICLSHTRLHLPRNYQTINKGRVGKKGQRELWMLDKVELRLLYL